MRFGWVGFHQEGLPALNDLLLAGAPIHAVLTLRPDLAPKRSSGGDYVSVCQQHGIPLHHIANINDPAALRILRDLDPDIVFAIGWHQIVRPEALSVARIGWIGAHAALLPHYRGRAPINWALIRGERRTGNTLVWLAASVETAEVIDQTAFPITPYDTAASLYERVATSNRDMLVRLLPRLLAGERPARPLSRGLGPPWPRRRPADGLIDWSQPNSTVYDFIRALTRPYPGAFGNLGGQRWLIWHAALPPPLDTEAFAGTVLGPIVSPVGEACGQVVACGQGAIVVLEVESDDGTVLRGRALSDQAWTGHRWTHD